MAPTNSANGTSRLGSSSFHARERTIEGAEAVAVLALACMCVAVFACGSMCVCAQRSACVCVVICLLCSTPIVILLCASVVI